jgi:hypothetical protein
MLRLEEISMTGNCSTYKGHAQISEKPMNWDMHLSQMADGISQYPKLAESGGGADGPNPAEARAGRARIIPMISQTVDGGG